MSIASRALLLIVIVAAIALPSPAPAYTGMVVDSTTQKPISNAIVTLGDKTVRTGVDGAFKIDGPGNVIGARAAGYLRRSVNAGGSHQDPFRIALAPFKPKALYLSFYGIGSNRLREAALGLIQKTELNAVVIDVKGDRGMVAYNSSVPLAKEIGAREITTIRDAKELIARLHLEHIYAIARIVVFKDNPLAAARPDLAVKRADGSLFRDRERLAWADPFKQEVWDYNISLAVEAAKFGFDEIQFDYVRFPDAKGLQFSKPVTMKSRLATISGFLAEAHRRLAPYNVFVAADIFGYVMWNLDDTGIGQRLEEIAPAVDYISPMLYPSCFQFGIPGYRNPVAHPHKIVYLSLENAQERTGLPPIRFRPWLQAFKDYAFDRREFTANEISAQISAAEEFGTDGWMLWNPRNSYTGAGLKAEGKGCKQDVSQ
ncbi:MAG TPA: putative glycoside hydrolase [Candidatus Binataceae bacterium]|nr:putative glycoside hydrolase [Candidatus Binataceae bacterium]